MPLLQLKGVSKTYGEHDVHALRQVDLTVEDGQLVALMGASGCGKSTLLNVIAGLDDIQEGDIAFDGIPLKGLTDEKITAVRGEKIGFIFQFFNLLSTLTVLENVTLPLELLGRQSHKQRVAAAREMLHLVGLDDRDDFFPAQLSGGQMPRVAIARALIHKPKLVIADEPTGNLDSDNGAMVLALLSKLNKELGQTLIMATHSAEAAAIADRVIQMKDGRIVI